MIITSSYNFLSNTIAPWVVNEPVAIATGIVCAIPALEMGIRACHDASDFFSTSAILEKEEIETEQKRLQLRSKLKNEFISHVAGSILLGACALNPFSASGVVGMIGFMIYSKLKIKSEMDFKNPSYSVVVTGLALTILNHYKTTIIKACFCKTTAAITFIFAKCLTFIKMAGHALKSFGHGVKKFVVYPFKMIARGAIKLASLLMKIGLFAAKIFLHKPLIGLGLITAAVTAVIIIKVVPVSGIVAAIDTLARHLFTAVIAVVKFIPDVAAAGGKVLLGTMRVVGTVLGFVRQ